jgi:hypothetical protein
MVAYTIEQPSKNDPMCLGPTDIEAVLKKLAQKESVELH